MFAKHTGPIDVVVDSTGLKVFGEGEWKMRKHGKSKRRTWRKLHLAVNPDTHEIEAETLTENSCDDASQVDDLLDQVDRPRSTDFTATALTTSERFTKRLEKRGIRAIIPPRRNAKIWQHGNSGSRPLSRDAAIREIRRRGRRQWKEESATIAAAFRKRPCIV